MPYRNYDYILKDPAIDRLFRYKTPTTKQDYLKVFKRFLDFTGPELGLKDPSSVVDWAKSRHDNLDVQDLIEKFGETQSITRRVVNMSVVRSLLKRNGVALPSMNAQRPVLKNFHRGYTRQELLTLLSYLDEPLLKLYTMFAKDSGLRSQDLLSLHYHHVKKDLEAEEKFVHLYLEPSYYNRRKASGMTFIGPNTIQLLKPHLSKLDLEKDPKLFPMSYSSVAGSLRLARNKAGLDRLLQPNHALRKFFEACLDRTGLDTHKKLQLEGHSQGVRVHYTDREVSELRLLYERAYQFLDLTEEGAAETRLKDLEKSLLEKTAHIEALKQEISKLKEEKPVIPEGLLEELSARIRRLEELEKKQSE